MGLSNALYDIRVGIANKASSVATGVSNVVTNTASGVLRLASGATKSVSKVVTDVAGGISYKVGKLKNGVVSALTISEENRKKIKSLVYKILGFIIKNKSLIFFGLTVLFSYYMAPSAAFEYLAKTGFSLTSSFVSGVFLGAGFLALKNIISIYPIRNHYEDKDEATQYDKINYLLGICNLCLTHLNPAVSLGASIGTAGLVTVITGYKFLFPADEIKEGVEKTLYIPKEPV